MAQRVTELRRGTGEAWTWTYTDEDGTPHQCHTDYRGEGVWSDGRQETGTCAFSLRGCTTDAARSRLRRWYGIGRWYNRD
jgi:hypothetical protein